MCKTGKLRGITAIRIKFLLQELERRLSGVELLCNVRCWRKRHELIDVTIPVAFLNIP